MNNLIKQSEVPMGLGMALAENLQAMQYFSSLSMEQQRSVIAHTHQIQSKQEMQQFVRDLADKNPSFF